nr:hypothetical protein [Actinomadura sp. J1-007]
MGTSTAASRSSGRSVSASSSRCMAAWTTPRSRCPEPSPPEPPEPSVWARSICSTMRAIAAASPQSAAWTVASTPRSASADTSADAPGASPPRRETSARRRAPRSARCRAVAAPKPLSPPVTR